MATVLTRVLAHSLERGDQVVVSPGTGRHRGECGDDGILEVCFTEIRGWHSRSRSSALHASVEELPWSVRISGSTYDNVPTVHSILPTREMDVIRHG